MPKRELPVDFGFFSLHYSKKNLLQTEVRNRPCP
jgi:hypothetical protein